MRFLNKKTGGLVLFFVGVLACSVQAQEAQNYVEQSPVIGKLLELKKGMGPNENVDKVYTIQVFSGKKDSAMDVMKKISLEHPDWLCDLQYEYPNFKLKLGSYRSRLEAEKELQEVKLSYPHAFVVNPKK